MRESGESVSPAILIENKGGRANFSINIIVKHNGKIIHSFNKTFELKKNEKIEETLYQILLNKRENEGVWEFNVKISASNVAGEAQKEVSAETNIVGAPAIKVTRMLEREKMRRGEDLKVTLTLENIGYGDAVDVSFDDVLPPYFKVVSGSKSWSGAIKEGERITFSYIVSPLKKGTYTFPKATVYYNGEIIKGLSSKSNENTVEVFGIPELRVTREFSQSEILRGGNTKVIVKITNIGDGIAKSISFTDSIPAGVSVISGSYSTERDIKPGETEIVSYTVEVPNKGQYTFPSIPLSYYDELGKLYKSYVPSAILTVYGIPRLKFENPTVMPGKVVGDITKFYVTIRNTGDGVAKSVSFSYKSLPDEFKHYSGSRTWSGTLNPGDSVYIEYSVLNDGVGTFSVGEADLSYKDEIGNSYSHKLSPISITVLGSKIVDSGLEVVFDDEWVSKLVPKLGICTREYEYWQNHPNHRPKWYYRIVLDKTSKRGVIQFFAYWPDQYDWVDKHPYDYEPIWIYFTYSGKNWRYATLKYIKYTKCHSKVSTYPTNLFMWDGNHPVFRLKSNHHAYDGGELYLPSGEPKIYYRDYNAFKLTDKVISEWNTHYDNPFIQSGDKGAVSSTIFKNPWILTDCFKTKCSLICDDDGEYTNGLEWILNEFGQYIL